MKFKNIILLLIFQRMNK